LAAHHLILAYIDLPVLYSDSSIMAFIALNNKEDTLTQSQMFKAPGYS